MPGDGAVGACLEEEGKQGGLLTLREEGVLMAVEGRTSLEEVLRVTQNDDESDEVAKTIAAGAPRKEAA